MNKEELHAFRKQIDGCIKTAEDDMNQDWKEGYPKYDREMALVRTKLQEAKMWAGKCLEAIGSEFPKELRDQVS